MDEILEEFRETIVQAAARRRPLRIRGSGSKDFYGGTPRGEVLDTTRYTGIVEYVPEELVLTARAGTPLAEIEGVLAAHGQMLAFEPPHFGPRATLGGACAAGLSGPRRPHAGALRDFVLGMRVMDGRGELLRFGGQVMKNVAGYDVSRLMVGALGTLGLILEISLKVLPRPRVSLTLQFEMGRSEALAVMNHWLGQGLPLTASCYHDEALTVRLEGAEAAVVHARRRLGGQVLEHGEAFWQGLKEQTARFFRDGTRLWRLSVPATVSLTLPGRELIEWGGAQRWLFTDLPADSLRERVGECRGHATLFRADHKDCPVFTPLPRPLRELHRRVKQALDPHGLFNPGRLYAEL